MPGEELDCYRAECTRSSLLNLTPLDLIAVTAIAIRFIGQAAMVNLDFRI